MNFPWACLDPGYSVDSLVLINSSENLKQGFKYCRPTSWDAAKTKQNLITKL